MPANCSELSPQQKVIQSIDNSVALKGQKYRAEHVQVFLRLLQKSDNAFCLSNNALGYSALRCPKKIRVERVNVKDPVFLGKLSHYVGCTTWIHSPPVAGTKANNVVTFDHY